MKREAKELRPPMLAECGYNATLYMRRLEAFLRQELSKRETDPR